MFVFYSNTVEPSAMIYMGKDKFENEDLIKYGLEQDIWFHVDNLSSAHVYLRLEHNSIFDWKNIPEKLLNDCAQLTKANSIEGNKKNNVTVIYTPWNNLKKNGTMDTGQVSFHKAKEVKKVYIEKRENEVINRLTKTKVEEYPDFEAEKQARLKVIRNFEKNEEKVRKQKELRAAQEKKKADEQKNYGNVLKKATMKTNSEILAEQNDERMQGLTEKEAVDAFEEDFM